MKNKPEIKIRNDATDDYWNYNLRESRIQAGLTLSELAEKVSVSYATISTYERMRNFPRKNIARKIAVILKKSIDEVFPEKFGEYVKEIKKERNGYKYDALDYSISLEDVSEREYPLASENPSEDASRNILKEELDIAIRSLRYREREIIKLRYGMGDEQAYTLKEIGSIFNVVGERIRQIEIKALRKLKEKLKKLKVYFNNDV